MSIPDRVVLEGVPRTYFHGVDPERKCGNPESLTLSSCLRAWLEFMGDGYGCRFFPTPSSEWRPECGYIYFVGLTGAGFWLGWDLPPGADTLTNPVLMAADPRAPFARLFTGIGYEHELLLAPGLVRTVTGQAPASPEWQEADIRARIVESLRAGRPIIGLGLVGPPEASLITGYDEGGAVLTGWSVYQKVAEYAKDLEFEPSGYFRVRDWFPKLHGLVVIGEKRGEPPVGAVQRSALEWALQVMRTPEVHGRPSGLAAYRAWLAALEEEGRFPAGDEEALRREWRLHNAMTGFLAEERYHADCFLRQVISYTPAWAADLEPAADSCGAQHDLMWGVWEYLRSWEPGEHHQRLTDGWLRERMRMLVRLALREDERVAAHVERALQRKW